MTKKSAGTMTNEMKIFFVILALTALGSGLSDAVFSNYFKDAYDVTAMMRGFIEFPRELPGLVCIIVISLLSFMGDIRMSILAQALCVIGLTALGLLTPPFNVMLIFLFTYSMGMHTFFPLQDSIGMDLVPKGDSVNRRMGQYKGVATAFGMLASLLIFTGFRMGFFSFTSPIKFPFVIGAIVYAAIFFLFIKLYNMIKASKKEAGQHPDPSAVKSKFIFRKEYKYYYILAVMHGVQKQIMAVYGPWVLIELLGSKADTMAILGIIGAFIGIFFMPALGHWTDRFGIKKMLYADALSFIVIYIAYGAMSAGFSTGTFATFGLPAMIIFGLFILDRMSMQMGFIKIVYLKSIAVMPSDITKTLSLGISMDHVVSIICATLGGLIWSAYGPQWIFFLAAALSCVNLVVAFLVKEKLPQADASES